MKWMKLLASALLVSGITTASFAQQAITLHGASQFGDDHAFTKENVVAELRGGYPVQSGINHKGRRRVRCCEGT